MSVDALSVKLSDLMEKETSLLNEISSREEQLQKALRESDWENLDKVISSLGSLSEEMEQTENERERVYRKLKDKLGKKEDDGFYSIAMHMKGNTRENCLGGYRKMKVALLRMQGITAGIDQYVRAVGATSREVLDEVFPHRKGKIYSNNGNAKPAQADPMVLNRHL